MSELNDNLTLHQVAKELDRSVQQVRRYVHQGKLPAQKLGMRWFVDRRALDMFKRATGKATRKDVLAQARALRQSISGNAQTVNVVELLEESRRRHP